MKKITLAIIVMIAFQGCDFEAYQIDPNRTSSATPGLLLTNLIPASFNLVGVDPLLSSRIMVYTDAQSESQYYNWNRAGFGEYNHLRQAEQMKIEAESANLPNYVALSKFFKAYHFYNLTMAFGDIPFDEALDGANGNFQPAYTPQEEIFEDILILLDEANMGLSLGDSEPAFLGDVLFNGDLLLWRKAVNSFRMRVLMTLSEKTATTTIDVVAQFNAIINDASLYPIIASNDDNFELDYFDLADNRYPYFNDGNIKIAYVMEHSFVQLLKDLQDPRLFQMAGISKVAEGSGLLPGDYNAYGGLDGHVSFTDMQAQFVAGIGSFANTRYSEDATVEPSIVMSYSEVQFILAEAIELGWTSGTAKTHYDNGVTANMEFYGITSADITSYISGPLVSYGGTDPIEQISTQKHLTYFLTGGYASFYNQRRTGFPTFLPTNFNDGLVPTRWMYPESESRLNLENVQEAIDRQFGGDDNINGQMWIVQ